MRFIKLTDEQKEKYPYIQDLLNLIEKLNKKMTLDEKLRQIEDYLEFCEEFAVERYVKGVLLGTNEIPTPTEMDYWSDEEKLKLFDRWDTINKLHALSLFELVKGQFEEDDEDEEPAEDPEKNNGKGLVS